MATLMRSSEVLIKEEMWELIAPSRDTEEVEKQRPKGVTKDQCVIPFGKRKVESKKNDAAEARGFLVEQLMAMFEVAAEEDAILNRQGKTCVNKLKKLPQLVEYLSKNHLQIVFVDHGVLALLKLWLEPLPDGSLPHVCIRQAILLILTDQFRLDLTEHFAREQLKKSGLGKVIMFLSRSDEETPSNRRLAQHLVNNWSRDIFAIGTQDVRNVADERMNNRPVLSKKPKNKVPLLKAKDKELDKYNIFSSGQKKLVKPDLHVLRPEPTLVDFVIRPPSKINHQEVVRAVKKAKQQKKIDDMRRKLKVKPKMQAVRASATKLW